MNQLSQVDQAFAPISIGEANEPHATDGKVGIASARCFESIGNGIPVMHTPKPSVSSPEQERKRHHLTEERVSCAFRQCFACVQEEILGSRLEDLESLIRYYDDQLKLSEKVFQNFFATKEQFNAALCEPHSRELTRKLSQQFLDALGDVNKELREMYNRANHLEINDQPMKHRKDLCKAERQRIMLMDETDDYHRAFLWSLMELLSALGKIEFILSEDQQLYQLYNQTNPTFYSAFVRLFRELSSTLQAIELSIED